MKKTMKTIKSKLTIFGILDRLATIDAKISAVTGGGQR